MQHLYAVLTVIAVALCATNSVVAQTDHRVPKSKPSAAEIDINIPPEKSRDPVDVSLDRRIKGIYRGVDGRPSAAL